MSAPSIDTDRRDRRRLRHLAFAIPAISVLLTAGGVLAWAHRVDADQLRQTYLERAEDAVNAEDLRLARLCFDRAIDLDGNYFDIQYKLAVALSKHAEHRQDAVQLMRAIAPENAAGHGPAHLWLGTAMLRAVRHTPTRIACERHLKRALKAGADPVRCHLALIEVYLSVGRLDLAQPHVQAARRVKALSDVLMLVYLSKWLDVLPDGKSRTSIETRARALAEKVEAHARGVLAEQPYDDKAMTRLGLALRFLGKREELIAMIEPVVARNDERSPRYRAVLADEYYEKAMSLPADKLGERVRLLIETLKLHPLASNGLRELIRLEDRPEARAFLATYRDPGAPPAKHGAIGTALLMLDRYDDAVPHLKIAHVADPDNTDMLNNLAYALKSGTKPDFDRALELIDRLLKTHNRTRFHDTRGRVLLAMGRYEDALKALEIGLAGVVDRKGTLLAMAEAYEKMGNEGMAARYRKRAEGQPDHNSRSPRARRLNNGFDPRLLVD